MRSGKRKGENRSESYKEKYMRRDFEFWSRRPYFGQGKIGKIFTHKAERRKAKRDIQKSP